LKLATENKKINIGSAFNNIQLKNRILAMTISKSDKLLKWLFLMLVPVLMLILFVSSIVQNSLQNVRMNNSFVAPLSTENNEIIVDFFKNKQVTDNNGKLVVISHDKISFLTKSFEPILAVSDGIVNSIDTVNNFGLIELNISIIHNNNITSKYLGLETILKTTDATVKKGDTIGKTGDNRLYETFDFQLLNNDSSINPRNYIEF
jgi:murein DD-endopeptidase MepM/ murein hydrolase activator NlpD